MVKVLITDDAPYMRSELKKILTKMGCRVIGEAENGIEAIKKYKLLRPDLVTMDISMPEMNGIDSVKYIKLFDPNAKIIMCSATGQQGKVIEAIQAGANDFIIKPFSKKQIKEALVKLIR